MYKVLKCDDVGLSDYVRKRGNAEKSWKYGYHPKYDIIVISKNGTIGEIYEINSLKIALPEKPAKQKILFNELPKKEQKWKLLDLPEFTKELALQYEDFIDEQFKLRDEGLFFFNNGKPTYITGGHYFFLQFCKIETEGEDDSPSFREPNRIYYIYLEACRADSRCLGLVLLKARRIGATTLNYCYNLNMATYSRNSKYGIVSKTNKDAENVFQKTVYTFSKLPWYFKPLINGMERPKRVLEFSEPSSRASKKNQEIKASKGLNTFLDYQATAKNSYDSTKLKGAVVDEVGKFPKDVNFIEYWYGALRKCFTLGRRFVGLAMVASTSNKLSDGGAEFKEIYYDSDPRVRNENGTTKTGLYNLFFKASDTLEGFYDEYGNVVVNTPKEPVMSMDGDWIFEGSKDYLAKEVKGLSGNQLLAERRQNPETEEDAFFDIDKGNNFNGEKIKEQMEWNDLYAKEKLVKGNLMWREGVLDGEVVFEPNPNGLWEIAWNPSLPFRNKIAYNYGNKLPGNFHLGAAGADPYDLDAPVDGRGSNGAVVFKSKSGIYGDLPEDFIFAVYNHRPKLAREFFEDVLKACVYFGMPLLAENNKYGLIRHFENRGYQGYLLKRPASVMSKSEKKSKVARAYGVPSSVDVIHAHAEAIQYWIERRVGQIDELGEIGKMYYNDILQDWAEYQIDNRTKYDLTVASGLAIMATQSGAYNAKVNVKTNMAQVRDIARVL